MKMVRTRGIELVWKTHPRLFAMYEARNRDVVHLQLSAMLAFSIGIVWFKLVRIAVVALSMVFISALGVYFLAIRM